MSTFRPQHEIYTRRASRNIGLGLALAVFVILAFSVTIVKMSQKQSEDPRALNFDPSAPSSEASE